MKDNENLFEAINKKIANVRHSKYKYLVFTNKDKCITGKLLGSGRSERVGGQQFFIGFL